MFVEELGYEHEDLLLGASCDAYLRGSENIFINSYAIYRTIIFIMTIGI